MILVTKRGQSLIEYSMLVIIIAAALMAMTTYFYHASNARVRRCMDEINYYRFD